MPRLDFYVNCRLFLKVRLDDREFSIGRGEECRIQLPDERVSRVHALVRCEGDAWVLEDRSRNGTRINASIVRGASSVLPRDRVYLGPYTLVFQDDGTPSEDLASSATVHLEAEKSGRGRVSGWV